MTVTDAAKQWINEKGEAVQFGGGEEKGDDRQPFQNLWTICEVGWQSHIAWESMCGESPQLDWVNLSEERKHEIYELTLWTVEHPTSSVSAQHDAWRARMAAKGIDHPNMVPFDELPFSQQVKARLWRHIIFAVVG